MAGPPSSRLCLCLLRERTVGEEEQVCMTLEKLCQGPGSFPKSCFHPCLAWPEGGGLGYKELEGYPPLNWSLAASCLAELTAYLGAIGDHNTETGGVHPSSLLC